MSFVKRIKVTKEDLKESKCLINGVIFHFIKYKEITPILILYDFTAGIYNKKAASKELLPQFCNEDTG